MAASAASCFIVYHDVGNCHVCQEHAWFKCHQRIALCVSERRCRRHGSCAIHRTVHVHHECSAGGRTDLRAPAKFEPVQLFQLLVGFVFGMLIDMNMYLISWIQPIVVWEKAVAQLVGCSLLAVGVAFEVRCGSLTMPGEGFPVALSKVTGIEFPKVKIAVDISLVALGVVACYAFFGKWQWHIIGLGTLFAMYYVGWAVRIVSHHLGWFDRLLRYRPGFRRYIYGLARYIYRK